MPSIKTQQNISLSQELRAAVTTASMGDRGKARNVMLVESDLPTLVPSKSLLKVRSVKFKDLKMGDIICIRVGADFKVRRFVKTKITRADTLLLVAQEGFDKKEPIPLNAYLGKVDAVEIGGCVFDPTKNESFWQNFMGKLTEFGTHKPFGIFKAG
jgi:phage pi2 protein 07